MKLIDWPTEAAVFHCVLPRLIATPHPPLLSERRLGFLMNCLYPSLLTHMISLALLTTSFDPFALPCLHRSGGSRQQCQVEPSVAAAFGFVVAVPHNWWVLLRGVSLAGLGSLLPCTYCMARTAPPLSGHRPPCTRSQVRKEGGDFALDDGDGALHSARGDSVCQETGGPDRCQGTLKLFGAFVLTPNTTAAMCG